MTTSSSLIKLKDFLSRNTWASAVLVGFLTLLAYMPVTGYDFVWDDAGVIVNNEYIREWKYLPDYFTSGHTFRGSDTRTIPVYRPMLSLCYLLEYRVYQLHPGYMHLTGAMFHALTAFLTVLFLTALLTAANVKTTSIDFLFAATLGALAWSLHPLTTEVVAWIKGRDDQLCTLFFISTLTIIIRGVARKHLGTMRMLAAGGTYCLALLSKEMAITLPVILLITGVFTARANHWTSSLKQRWWLLLGTLSLLSVFFLLLRTYVLGSVQQTPYLTGSFSTMMATMSRALVRYLHLILWPWWPNQQNVDYMGYPLSQSWFENRVMFSIGVLVVVATLTWHLSRKAPLLSLGILFILIALAPVLNVVPTMQVMAERFLYLPLIGWSIIVATAVWKLSLTCRRRFARLIAALYALALLLATEMRLPVWKNELSLYQSAYTSDPANWRAALNLATTLLKLNRVEESAALTRKLRTTWPDVERYKILEANVARAKGDLASAEIILNQVGSRLPDHKANAYIGIAGVYLRRQNYAEARRCYENALRLKPDWPNAWYDLALIGVKETNPVEAEKALTKFRELSPQTDTSQLEAAINQLHTSETVRLENRPRTH